MFLDLIKLIFHNLLYNDKPFCLKLKLFVLRKTPYLSISNPDKSNFLCDIPGCLVDYLAYDLLIFTLFEG